MKYIFILLLAFSFNAFATDIDDAKTIMQTLSGKTMNNAQVVSVASKYSRVNGFSNPWIEEDNPTEYADWPTNLETAAFFKQHVRGYIRGELTKVAARDFDVTERGNRQARKQAYADEL